MSKVWPYPGARWWKFDFHTHTPASKDTGAWQVSMGTPDEVTPQKWLLKYMAAEIDCVAITDHNSGEWIDKLKTAYAEMKSTADVGNPTEGFRELYLFPGVEISVQGGFHLLAIFDPSASTQTISDLLAKVEYAGTRGDSDGVTREGAAKVVQRVLTEGGLAIPAHVERDKGLLKVEPGMRKCMLDANTVKQILQNSGILALEWAESGSPTPMILDELKLRFASVVGSDCHNFKGLAVPGSRYTWIKMAKPSLEGLRLALLDGQEISVKRSDESNGFDPFKTPEHFIESIEIQNARFMGRGKATASFPLNPYFNALIGGRGTGKSTVVHALRLAYRREKELTPNSEAEQTFNRFNKIAKNKSGDGGLLTDTIVNVRVHRDGVAYRLSWQQAGQEHNVEEWDPTISDFKPSVSQAINEQRFPARLFSQGQIAALAGDDQQTLLNVIDAAADTQKHHAAFEEAKRTFLSSRANMRELEVKLQEREALTLSLQDVHRKLARFEGTDHQEVLKNYQHSSRQSNEFERQFQIASELATRLQNDAADYLAEDPPEGLFDADGDSSALECVQELKAAIDKARQEVENAALTLQRRTQVIREELKASAWFARLDAAKGAYDRLNASLQQEGVSNPREYGRLVQERQRLESELKKLESVKNQYAELRENAKIHLEQVQLARQAISTQRSSFLKAILKDNPFVRIELIPYSRDVQVIEKSLREILGVVDGKYTDDFYKEQDDSSPNGIIANLIAAVDLVEKPGKWDTETFEQSLQSQKKRLILACRGKNEFGGRFNKFLKAEAEKRPEYSDHILCWFPEDGLQVEYSRKGDGRDFQSIGQASAGQRAAAMLAFLLAHGNEVLVLDQPEDDLDNHLIYSLVVQQIRTNKMRRQLIIVTHNPNIVVNGDAELIHVLDFNHQCHVKQSGSLQDQVMRREVCQVMEGGEEAFERRYQRLGRDV